MTEQDNKSPVQEAPPMKLDVSVRAIEAKGNLLGFANVKFNDCFVVEDFKILQTDKGLYVGMPSKPDKSSKTGYRDTEGSTALPIYPHLIVFVCNHGFSSHFYLPYPHNIHGTKIRDCGT